MLGCRLKAYVTATETAHAAPLPLTVLNEEEKMFQSMVRRFARERIGPHVREMDEAGVFRKDLLHEMFELGLMGIEIPEEYGGQGGNFFQSVLAVEALAAVDPSAAVIVDVQNTIANNILLRWGNDEQKRRYLPRLAQGHGGFVRAVGSRLGLGCLRHGHPRHPGRRSLPHHRPQAVDHQCRGSRALLPVRQRQSGGRAIAGSPASWSSATFPAFRSARRRTSSASAPPPPAS